MDGGVVVLWLLCCSCCVVVVVLWLLFCGCCVLLRLLCCGCWCGFVGSGGAVVLPTYLLTHPLPTY